jgi:aminocarboxymuconate-semialdehyde decarboxylase
MQREFIDFAQTLMAERPGAVTALVGVNPFAGDAALRAMEEAVRGGGFPGVTVNTSIDGELLDSPRAAGFWALVAELDVPVFLHPPLFVSPQQVDWDPRFLGFAVRPLDVSLCVAAIVTAGILERYPRLRIVCASGGGALAELSERLNLAYSQMDLGLLPEGAMRAGASSPPAAELKVRPSEYIRRLYVDTCVHGTHALLANLDLFGPGQMVFGTDSPPLMVSMTGEIEVVESLLTTDGDREQVLWRNAAGLLGLPDRTGAQIPATRTATSKI